MNGAVCPVVEFNEDERIKRDFREKTFPLCVVLERAIIEVDHIHTYNYADKATSHDEPEQQ